MPSDNHKHDHAQDHDHNHDQDHKHDHAGHSHAQAHSHDHGGGACCGSQAASSVVPAPPPSSAAGRSFQVSGLDCVEEVAILNKVVGPKIGGAEHLAFDVINGRMTILDSADTISDDEVTKLVASTGMSARPWSSLNRWNPSNRASASWTRSSRRPAPISRPF